MSFNFNIIYFFAFKAFANSEITNNKLGLSIIGQLTTQC